MEGRRPAEDVLIRTENVMGTVVSFRLRSDQPAANTSAAAVEDACRLLWQADEVFSTWRADSPLSRLRRGEVSLEEVPAVVRQVLRLCQDVKERTRGWFDPWAMPGGVDPTGLVKGWAVEQVVGALRRAGVGAALVNAGGDLAGFAPPGSEPWRIGVRHPWLADRFACILTVDAAVATSGPYERALELIDPHTGKVATGIASATVTGPSLAVADGFATALAVGGDDAMEAVAEISGYEAYLIRDDGTERWTAGMAFVD